MSIARKALGRPFTTALTVRNELVEVLAPNDSVQVIDEMESFLIGHFAESIVRIDACVIDKKLSELMVLAKRIYGILCHAIEC